MASLKCSHCGFRIHYHDEPNGIEYTALSQKLWDLFSDTDKPIARYVLDGNDDFLCIWRCPECGCIHSFEAYRPLFKQAYVPCENASISTTARKYLVFVDFLFEDISEKGLTAQEFVTVGKKYSTNNFFYAMISSESFIVYCDETCTQAIKKYKAIVTKNTEKVHSR